MIPVCGVGSCGGWLILGQSYTRCSAVSFQFPHFLQMVSIARPFFMQPVHELRVVATSQTTRRRLLFP